MENELDTLTISEEEEGMRLDAFLSLKFSDYSRRYFQSLIEKKLVLVNSELVKKSTKLTSGDEVEIEFAITSEISIEPEPIPLDILFEDSHLIAINKPPDLVVHPAVGNWTGTFVNALLYHCKNLPLSDTIRPGIVHRLDKQTTGVLLAAKDERTQRKLVELFSLRKIEKEYRAICIGNPGNQLVDGPIGRHPRKRKEMAVVQEKGKQAQTEVQTLHYNDKLSYVKLTPLTGRTHQLRVHLKYVGTPILGDPVYGNLQINKKFNVTRQLLHAYRLSFVHPITEEHIEFKAPIPQDMTKFIQLF